MKICCASSAGGHLTELLQLKETFENRKHYFLTDKRLDSKELADREKVFFVECPRRNPLKLIVNLWQSMRIFLKEKPDVVISTGADTAIATCLIAKLFGKRVVFLESFCRIREKSLSGRIMYRLADLFLVQWRENIEFYPKAEYAGSVF